MKFTDFKGWLVIISRIFWILVSWCIGIKWCRCMSLLFTLGGKFPIPLGLPNHPSHWRFKDLHFPLGGSTLWWCDDWENFTRSLVIDPFWSDIMEKSLCLLYLVNCVRSGGSKVGRKIVMTCHSCPSIKSDQKISMWHSCKYIPKASKSVIHAGRWLEMTMGGYARRVQQEWEFKIEDFDLTPWWEWWIMTETGVISTWVEFTPVKRSTPIPSKRIWKLPRLQSLIKSFELQANLWLVRKRFPAICYQVEKKGSKVSN